MLRVFYPDYYVEDVFSINYEKLMEGFAFNRMGLPLLKARRRRS